MSITINDMRFLISQVYTGDKWKNRVQRMDDRQVMAIYFSFCERGEFNKKSKEPERPKQHIDVSPFDVYVGEQVLMDCIFK